jgi:hypothetical protein
MSNRSASLGSRETLLALVEKWRAAFPASALRSRDDYYAGQACGTLKCSDQLAAALSCPSEPQVQGTRDKAQGSPGTPAPAGNVNGVLYCYGGCGRRYEDFGLDTILPTPLWNQIAVGPPFREPHPADEKEGRGGVLCAACIVLRLAKLPDTTVAHMTVDA